jgi:hypothetical protein
MYLFFLPNWLRCQLNKERKDNVTNLSNINANLIVSGYINRTDVDEQDYCDGVKKEDFCLSIQTNVGPSEEDDGEDGNK